MNNWRQILSWRVPVIHHKDVIDEGFHYQDDPATDDMVGVPVKAGERVVSDWSYVNCPICLENKVEAVLYKAHNREAKRRRAEFMNFGWASGDTFVHSKTNRGKLYSEIDPKTLEVTHDWTD